MDEEFTVSVIADTSAFEAALSGLEKQAQGFGSTLTLALKSAIVEGDGLVDVLRAVALQLSGQALNAGLSPLSTKLNALSGNLFASLAGALPFAQGGVIGGNGHVLSQPTYFPTASHGLGVAGEAGAEAIMPLSRGPDGTLGVSAPAAATPAPIIVNISTPDIQSFQRAEGQIAAAIARAASAGRRAL